MRKMTRRKEQGHAPGRQRRPRRNPWASTTERAPVPPPQWSADENANEPTGRNVSSWEKFTRRYVWDEQKTPFFVAVPNLNRGQAWSEMLLFGVFLGTPFILFLVGAVMQVTTAGAYEMVSVAIYAASILAAIGVLWTTRHWLAAIWCITAPIALLIYGLADGYGEAMAPVERLLMMIVLGAWAFYSVRIVAIARAYATMPAPPPRRPPGHG